MIRFLSVSLMLAGLVQWTGATDQIVTQTTQQTSAAFTFASNAPAAPEIPQLSANPATESEIQSRRMVPPTPATNAPPSPVKKTFPPIQNVTFFIMGGMIAFLVIVAITGRRPKE